MAMFYVYVNDHSEKRYFVEADSAEEATALVEQSDDVELVYETVGGTFDVTETISEEDYLKRFEDDPLFTR